MCVTCGLHTDSPSTKRTCDACAGFVSPTASDYIYTHQQHCLSECSMSHVAGIVLLRAPAEAHIRRNPSRFLLSSAVF